MNKTECAFILTRGKNKGKHCSYKTDDIFCKKHSSQITDEMKEIQKSINLTHEQLNIHLKRPELREKQIDFCKKYIQELKDDLNELIYGVEENDINVNVINNDKDIQPRPIIKYTQGPSKPICY